MSQKRSFRKPYQGCQIGPDVRQPEEMPAPHSREHDALVAKLLGNFTGRQQGRTNVTKARQLEVASWKKD